jgi:hypothetical protein
VQHPGQEVPDEAVDAVQEPVRGIGKDRQNAVLLAKTFPIRK